MSPSAEASQPPAIGLAERTTRLAVDRVACTGHGICASLLPEMIDLDEWGYPVVRDDRVTPRDATTAVALCPARALYARSVG